MGLGLCVSGWFWGVNNTGVFVLDKSSLDKGT